MERSEKTQQGRTDSRYDKTQMYGSLASCRTQPRKDINKPKLANRGIAAQRLVKDSQRCTVYSQSTRTEDSVKKSIPLGSSKNSLRSEHFVWKCNKLKPKLQKDATFNHRQSSVGISRKGVYEMDMQDSAECASADQVYRKVSSSISDEAMEVEYLEDAFDSSHIPNEPENIFSQDCYSENIVEAIERDFTEVPEDEEELNTLEGLSASYSCGKGQDLNSSNSASTNKADDSWKKIPNEICRLCAKAQKAHPKQSIVKWLGLLNEIVPGMVTHEDGLPQYLCAPCGSKLYTCIKSKMEFIEADEILQGEMGFVKIMTSDDDFYECNKSGNEPPEEEEDNIDVSNSNNETEDVVTSEDYTSDLIETWEERSHRQVEAEQRRKFSHSEYKEDFTSDSVEARDDGASSPDSDTYEVEYLLPEFYDDNILNGGFANRNLKFTGQNLLHETAENRSSDNTKFVEILDNAIEDKCSIKKGNPIDKKKVLIESTKIQKCDSLKNKGMIQKEENLNNLVDQLVECGTVGSDNVEFDNEFVEENISNSNSALKDCNTKTGKQLFNRKQKLKIDYKYICTDCEGLFTTKESLRQHRILHHSDTLLLSDNADTKSKFICEVCGANFSSKINFILHKSYHRRLKNVKNFKCLVCNKRFAMKSHLTYHLLGHSKRKPFACQYCPKHFRSKIQLKEHEPRHFPPTIPCSECRPIELFYTKTDLEMHMKLHSSNFICEICGESLSSRYIFETHLKSHEITPYKCPICGDGFTSKCKLSYHKAIHSDKSLICSVCGKVFKSNRNLTYHMQCHTKDNTFVCPICLRTFSSKSNQIRHLKVTCTLIICIVCRQTFPTIAEMEKHRSTHSQAEVKEAARSYNMTEILSCASCSLHITGIAVMEHHLLSVHDVNKILKCAKCTLCFLNEQQLQEHEDSCGMRTMNKDSSVEGANDDGKCKICLKFISSKRKEVNKHMIEFHKDYRPFKCKICTKSFKTNCALKQHSMFHSSIMPYSCNICGRDFKYKSTLRLHISSVHMRIISIRQEFKS